MHPTSRWPSFFGLLSLLAVFVHSANALFPRPNPPPPPGKFVLNKGPAPAHVCNGSEPNTGTGYFDQILDHSVKTSNCKAQRTFRQRYYWSNATWGGPGYPIIVTTPGEAALDGYCGYLWKPSLVAQIAERVKGAVLVIEHRYYGESSPFPRLTTQTMQQLTLQNAVHDLTHFARNVKLPFDPASNSSRRSNAPNAPWILSGGSYGGALTAWTASLAPDTFWAYHASSAPVQSIYDFWSYFEPIRAGMPANCSRDLADVTAYVDNATLTLPPNDLAAFKDTWGLGEVTNPVDFASSLVLITQSWQDNRYSTNYTKFYKMCDVLEGYGESLGLINGNGSASTNSSIVARYHSPLSRSRITRAVETTTDIAKKVADIAAFFKQQILPGFCYNYFGYDEYAPNNNTNSSIATCLNSDNTSSILFTDRAVNNSYTVQWTWMLCNEPFFWYQTGNTPPGIPGIASRLMTAEYFQRTCELLFGPKSAEFQPVTLPLINSTRNGGSGDHPDSVDTTGSRANTYGSAAGKTAETFNAMTGGWNFEGKRVLWVNGEFDPWRSASVSSHFRPGGPLESTPDAPVIIIKNGRHCEDVFSRSNSTYLASVMQQEVDIFAGWVDDFYDATTLPGQNRTVPKLMPRKAAWKNTRKTIGSV